jgi:SAM-dependent methyltransferase
VAVIGEPELRAVAETAHTEPTQPIERIKARVRFALPPDATVAVVTDGRANLLRLEGRKTWALPRDKHGLYAGPYPGTDADAVAQVEAVRTDGAQFLLIPGHALWWLDYYEGLRRHLVSSYRIVLRDESCLIFALHREGDSGSEPLASDGLPIPPPELRALTIGNYWSHAFLDGGTRVADAIAGVLERSSLQMSDFESVLDFGCGCGRVLRRWKDVPLELLAGADYNPYMVSWCRQALPFARFQRAIPEQPLDHDRETFDFIYAFSVFTHLDRPAHDFWIEELQRLLRPGGFMYLTFRGELYANILDSDERARFDAGEMVVKEASWSGSNACLAHHPESFVRNGLAPELSLEEFVPADDKERGGDQVALDGALFRKL